MDLMNPLRRRGSPAPDIENALRQKGAMLETAIRERDALAERLRTLEGGLRQELSLKGLFVIGHSRSGTTILENALNDHREIFIFNEADFYSDSGARDFRARHNAMHQAFRNQENKGSFCPKLFDEDESWDRYVIALSRVYRYVGSKIVIHQDRNTGMPDQLFDFMTKWFYGSHFIFTFRNPADVLGSNRGLAAWTGGESPDCRLVMRSFLWVMRLYIRALRNLPNVRAIFHEQVSPQTFEALSDWLGLDLRGSFGYYSDTKVKAYSRAALSDGDRLLLERTEALYAELSLQACAGYELVQIDQNNATIDPTHGSRLGELYRRIDEAIAAIDASL